MTVTADDGKAPAISQDVAVTVQDLDDEPTVLTLTPVTVTENDPGAILAVIEAIDPDTDLSGLVPGDVGLSDTVNFRVIDDAGVLKLALADGVPLDFEAGTQPSVTVTVNGTAVDFTPSPLNDETDDVVPNTDPTAEAGTGSTAEDTVVIIDIAALIADAEDGEPVITAATSANGDVTIDGTELTFTPALDFNGEALIDYTVTDAGGLTASNTVTVTVDPVNDAPTLGGTLDAVTVTDASGTTVDLGGLDLADIDTVLGNVTLGVRLAGGGAAPVGVTVTGTTLTIPDGLEIGTLELEIFANDGALDSDSVVPLTVTVEAPADLAYVVPSDGEVVIQLENRDGSITINDNDTPDVGGVNNTDLTQFRDSLNPERANNGTPQEASGKTGGLWDGKTGEGYLDMGTDVGDQATFDVAVPVAGDYTFVFRYNNGSDFNDGPSNDGNGTRPMAIAVDGTVQATPDFARGFNDAGQLNSWTDWQTETVTLTLQEGTSTISMTNTVANGPNLDSVTVARFDAPPSEIVLTAEDVAENVPGAVVATVTVTDVDSSYMAADLTSWRRRQPFPAGRCRRRHRSETAGR